MLLLPDHAQRLPILAAAAANQSILVVLLVVIPNPLPLPNPLRLNISHDSRTHGASSWIATFLEAAAREALEGVAGGVQILQVEEAI